MKQSKYQVEMCLKIVSIRTSFIYKNYFTRTKCGPRLLMLVVALRTVPRLYELSRHSHRAPFSWGHPNRPKAIRPKEKVLASSKTMLLGEVNASKHCCDSLLGLGAGLGVVLEKF